MATATAAEGRFTAPTLTVDDLAAMTTAELDALYRQCTVPDSLSALDGTPPGRMLAIRGLDSGTALGTIANIARHRAFPWDGKSFRSHASDRGEGINRTTLLGDVYRFETSIQASAIDSAPAVYLEYDLPENPFFIRAIWDEVREASPGLFFGPAMIKRRSGAPTLVLWFACDNS